MSKKCVQEGVLEIHYFKLIFDARMGGLDRQKQTFRIIRVAKHLESNRLLELSKGFDMD